MAVSSRQVQNKRDGSGALTGKAGTVYDVNIKYTAPDGKKKSYAKKGFSTKKEATQHEAEMKTKLQNPGQIASISAQRKQTVKSYLDDWVESYARVNLRPSTYDGYKRTIANYVTPYIGGVALNQLTPTYLVLSGAGLHLYYVFDFPIDLYPNIKIQLKALKYDLTFRIWEYKSTSTKEQIEYQSINQGFRMVGSINDKYGTEIKAFRVGDRVSLEKLNQYVTDLRNKVDVNRPFQPSKMTRAAAKEAYPEWYQRVVVEKKKRLKKWDIKSKQGYALYEWWVRQMDGIKGGHRYYFLMCLAIYACKCDVPKKKLREDMYVVYEDLRRVEHDNPLTEEDIESALEAYDKEYYNFTISDIEKLTDIRIERNRRNKRKQTVHLKIARAAQMADYPNNEWRYVQPSAEQSIREYMQAHPEARKCDVIKGTGASKPTVYKYFNKIKQEQAAGAAALSR